MFRKTKYVFSDSFQTEAKILAVIKIVIGLLCLSSFIYHIHLYSTAPTYRNGNHWPFIESNWKDQNLVARFLMWGANRYLFLIIIPYLDSIAMTGSLLLLSAHLRISELLQTWIIVSIIFCMMDFVLILPAATYAEYKSLLLFAYIHSYIQKMYSFWIVKGLLLELAEEKSDSELVDQEFAAGRRASKRY